MPLSLASPALAALAVLLVLFTLAWVASLQRNDVGVVDLLWGPGFVAVGLVHVAQGGAGGWPGLLLLLAVGLWGTRLGVHLWQRHRCATAEDRRYAAMRARAGPAFRWTSLPTVFWLQALILWAIATPLHAALPSPASPWSVVATITGTAIFAIGLTLEVEADRQLARFRREPRNRGKLLTSGLFALVRHPHYLGEITLWWGLGLAALGASGHAWAFVGPALLTLIMLRLSGPPMLAGLLKDREGYAAWVARTPALFPLPRLRG